MMVLSTKDVLNGGSLPSEKRSCPIYYSLLLPAQVCFPDLQNRPHANEIDEYDR